MRTELIATTVAYDADGQRHRFVVVRVSEKTAMHYSVTLDGETIADNITFAASIRLITERVQREGWTRHGGKK